MKDEVGNVATNGLAGNLVKGEMNACVNAGAGFFVSHCRKPCV